MLVQMSCEFQTLAWWRSPKTEITFFQIIIVKIDVILQMIFADKSFTAISTITHEINRSASIFQLVSSFYVNLF